MENIVDESERLNARFHRLFTGRCAVLPVDDVEVIFLIGEAVSGDDAVAGNEKIRAVC